MSDEMKQLNAINAHEQYVKIERDKAWAQGHASGWNSAIDAAISECDRISDTEIYADIVTKLKELKK